MNDRTEYFADPQAVARYSEGAVRIVPGVAHLQRMTMLLLAERVPREGRVLVLGAGGGLELKVFAEAHPDWRFDGVDPSAEMLKLAGAMLGPLASRVHMHLGYIDVAPNGPFDGAACLLTMHFIAFEERRRTLREIQRRLAPGAPLVVAHLSFPQGEAERALWLSRYVAFAVDSGVEREKAESARAKIAAELPIFAPEQDEALLREAGFVDVSLFYVGFAFRGWVGYARHS